MYRNPSSEDVAHAKAMMRWDFRGVDTFAQQFQERFGPTSNLHHLEIIPQADVALRAYVFLETNADVARCEAEGLTGRMSAFLTEIVAAARPGDAVEIELDSHENVRRNFNGNYFLRLRA